MRSSTKPLGMSKTAENNQKDDFQRIQKSWCIYLAFILQLSKCWGPHCHFGPFWAGIDVLDSSFDSSMSLNGFIRYPDLRLSNNLEKNTSRLPSPLKITYLAVFGPYGRSWQVLGSPHCLWLVPKGTLTCEKSSTTWVSPITLKKVSQDCCLLWKSPIWLFLALLDILKAPWKSSLSPIGSIRYPDMQRSQNTASPYHNLKQNASRLLCQFFVSYPIKFPIENQQCQVRHFLMSDQPEIFTTYTYRPKELREWMGRSEPTKCVFENRSTVSSRVFQIIQ